MKFNLLRTLTAVCMFLTSTACLAQQKVVPTAKDPAKLFSSVNKPSVFPVSCSPLSYRPCNLIENNDFHTPTPGDAYNDDVFGQDLVLPWQSGSGTCTIYPGTNTGYNPDGVPFPPPPGAATYVFGGVSNDNSSYPVISESIVQKIPAIVPGHTYVLSFFVSHRDYSNNPYIGVDYPLDHLNIHLINCDDYNATFNPSAYTYPPVPSNSQQVYCQTTVANHAWERVFVHFVAQAAVPGHPLNMIWIWPEQDPAPATYSGMYMALPELYDVSDYANQVQQGSLPNCMATLPSCGPINSIFNWEGPFGQTITVPQGQTVNIDVSNPTNVGTWTLIMTAPDAVVTNNTCSQSGLVLTTVEVLSCQTTSCSNNINCTPIGLSGCNHLPNGDFSHLPAYNPSDPDHLNNPFNAGLVPGWGAMHGTPQIDDEIPAPVTVPPPTIAGYSYMFSTGPGYYGNGQASADGIAAKISPLTPGNSYAMTFFKKLVKPAGSTVNDMDKFYLVLMHCSDFAAMRRCNNTIPDFPANSQIVYCESNLSNSNWEQVFFCFSADQAFDMVWVFPRQSDGVPYNGGAGAAGVDFTGLELINTTNFNAGPQPVAVYPNCTVTIGPSTPNCGVRNAVFTWTDSYGNVTTAAPNQQMQVTASPYYYLSYTLEMSVPGATYVDLPCLQCTQCKTVKKTERTSFLGGNCTLWSYVGLPPCQPNYNTLNCDIVTANQCSKINNSTFIANTGYPPFMYVTPFNYNLIQPWKQSHGDPRLNVGNRLSPFGNNAVSMKGWSERISNNPIIVKRYGDGVFVKIPKLTIGNSYLLSLFVTEIRLYPTSQFNGIKARFVKCSSLGNYGMPNNNYEQPAFLAPSQDVLCLSEMWWPYDQDPTWEQMTKCFTATDEWDAVWIYADVYLSRSVNGEPVKSWIGFSEPELVNLSAFTAGTPVQVGPNTFRIGPNTPNCGVRNAAFTWTLPDGSEVPAAANQQMIVSTLGNYTLTMKIPKKNKTWYNTEQCNLTTCVNPTASTNVGRMATGGLVGTGTAPAELKGQVDIPEKTPVSQIQSVSIYNSAGQLIRTLINSEDITQLMKSTRISSVPAGLYMIRILKKDKTVVSFKKYMN